MDLIKRFGTQKKKFKLQFFIGKLRFNTFYQGKVYIVARRGSHKVKCQQKLEMPEDCKLNFNKEILELEVTLYFDEKQNKYQQKPGQLDIVMIDPNRDKILLGIVSFDVGQYANLGQESIKEKKPIEQTPKGFEGLIEYNVFIKYIGEGSESSLDKVADFFFGKSKQPESQKKAGSKNDIPSNSKISDEPMIGSTKELPKTDAKKGTTVDFYEFNQPPNQKQKNYVTTAKEREGSRQFVEDNQELAKNFYLDDSTADVQRKQKKSKQRSNSTQKKKEKAKKGDSEKEVTQRDSTKQQKAANSKNETPGAMVYYAQQQQIQNLRQQVADYKKNYQQCQHQLSEQQWLVANIRTQNEKLQKQLAQCKEQLKQKDQQLQEQKAFKRKGQPKDDDQVKEKLELLQKELKRVEKQKNEIIVENSKLKQKYKQDFKKYEQLLSQKQHNQQSKSDSVKADVQKLKQQCSQYRQTIEKLTKQKSDKSQQLNKQKHQNKVMQEQLTEVKTSLSKIKLKICNKLNQVLVKDQHGIVDILMDLNKDD